MVGMAIPLSPQLKTSTEMQLSKRTGADTKLFRWEKPEAIILPTLPEVHTHCWLESSCWGVLIAVTFWLVWSCMSPASLQLSRSLPFTLSHIGSFIRVQHSCNFCRPLCLLHLEFWFPLSVCSSYTFRQWLSSFNTSI